MASLVAGHPLRAPQDPPRAAVQRRRRPDAGAGDRRNTAIFGVVDAVLLRPLPYRDPERLVVLYEAIPQGARADRFLGARLRGFEQRARSFESIAAFRQQGVRAVRRRSAGPRDRPRVASASLFDALGVHPRSDATSLRRRRRQRRAVVVLGDGLWRRKFGADPERRGPHPDARRAPYTVVGVMPTRVHVSQSRAAAQQLPADLYVPIGFTERERQAFGSMYNNSVVARLKPGVSVAAAKPRRGPSARRSSQEIYPAGMLAGSPCRRPRRRFATKRSAGSDHALSCSSPRSWSCC